MLMEKQNKDNSNLVCFKAKARERLLQQFSKEPFLNGELIEGTKITKDKIISNGRFKDDFLNGLGKIILPEGTIIEGQFHDDSLKGQGKITFKNGKVEEG